jgi:hypothetical protein
MDQDPDPALFFRGFQDITLQRYHSKASRSHKTVEIKIFLIFYLLVDGRIHIQIKMTDPDPGSSKTTDPDPEHS